MNNNEYEEILLDLVRLIKQARNESLLGLYDSALIHYYQAMIIIQSKINDKCNGNDIIEKWKITKYNIKNEIIQIKQINEICKEINNVKFNYSKKQVENIENKKLIEKEILDMLTKENKTEKKINNFLSISNDSNKKHKIFIAKINLINDNKNNDTKINKWLDYKGRKSNDIIIKNKINILQKDDNTLYLKKSKSPTYEKQKMMINPIEKWYYRTKYKKNNDLIGSSFKKKTETNINRYSMTIKNDDINLHKKLSTQNLFRKHESFRQFPMNIIDNNLNKLNKRKSFNTKTKRKVVVVKIDLDEELKIDNNDIKKEDKI